MKHAISGRGFHSSWQRFFRGMAVSLSHNFKEIWEEMSLFFGLKLYNDLQLAPKEQMYTASFKREALQNKGIFIFICLYTWSGGLVPKFLSAWPVLSVLGTSYGNSCQCRFHIGFWYQSWFSGPVGLIFWFDCQLVFLILFLKSVWEIQLAYDLLSYSKNNGEKISSK